MSQPADFAAPVTMAPLKSRHGDAKHPDSDDNSVRAYEAAPDLSNHEDAVFGGTNADGPNYRNVGWMAAAVLMMKAQVGLGVLSLPATFHTLGLITVQIDLVLIAVLWTYGAYEICKFKHRHPEVYSIADVGLVVLGKPGLYICAGVYWLWMTTVAGSALLSISIAFNAMSLHGTCTAVFVAVATIIVFLLASIQTLDKVAWITWAGALSLVVSLFLVTIAVGVTDRPAAAPATGPFDKDFRITSAPTFAAAMSAVSQLSFAYAGTPAYLSIMSEMKDSRLYTRSLLLCNGFTTVLYIVVGTVVYYYCGQYVASPALGSAGPLIKRIAYGLGLPALIVSGILYTHVPAKWIFLSALKGTKDLNNNTPKHWIVWLSCVAGCVLFSYVIASAIPVFSGLVGLVGALFGTFLCTIVTSSLWFYDNWGKSDGSLSRKLIFGLNCAIFLLGWFVTVAGTYGSIEDIIIGYAANGGTRPWACDDNSNST